MRSSAHSDRIQRRTATVVAGLMLCGSLVIAPAALAESTSGVFQQILGASQAADPADSKVTVAAPTTPEAADECYTADAVAKLCGTLEFEGSDASVDAADHLDVFVKDGSVWVVQKGEGGVVKPKAADGQAVAAETRFDLQKLDRSGLAAVRAYALYGELTEQALANGEYHSAETAAAASAMSDEKVEGVEFTSLTWVVVDKDDKPVCAFVFGMEEETAGAVETVEPSRLEALLAETEVPEEAKGIEPEYRLQTAAFYEADGWWVGYPEYDVSKIMVDWSYYRTYGDVPNLPDGRKVDDPTFSVKVVDESATETQVWVVDEAAGEDWVWVVDKDAWKELVWVDTSHYEDVMGYYCLECNMEFADLASAQGHYEYWDYIDTNNYLWLNSDGDWICVWCDINFGSTSDSYGFGLMHMYADHTQLHEPVDCVIGQTWVVSGQDEWVEHPEEGHWDSVKTEEKGHWETAKTAEKSHWDTNKLGDIQMK